MPAAAPLQMTNVLRAALLGSLLAGASAVYSHPEPTCADFSIALGPVVQDRTRGPNKLRYTKYEYTISAVDEDGPYDITNFTISNETWGPTDPASRCLVRMPDGREPEESDFDSIGSDNHFGVYGINENGTGFQVGTHTAYLVLLRGHLDTCDGLIHIHAVNENNVGSPGVNLECPAQVPCCADTLDCRDYTVDLVGVPTYNNNQDVTYFQYNVSCQGVTVSETGPDLKDISHWDLSNNSWVASDLACFDINESLSTPTQPWSSGFDGSGQWPNFADIYGIKYDNGPSCPGVNLYTLALNGQVDVCDGEYIVKAGNGFAFCPGKVPCCSGGSTPAPAPPTCPPNFIEAVIDFENIGANVMPSQFCSGSGFSSPGLSLSPTACVGLQTNGSNGGPNIFDATCNNGTAVNCSGGDTDLFQPQEGDVLILQNNNNGGVTSVPNDDTNGGCFNFTMDALLADGSVASVFIASVTLLDVEETPVLITALLGNGTIVDAESLKLSDGSIQDVLLNWEDVELLTVCLPGVSGAVGDITVCLEPEDPKTDSTSTSTSTSSSSSSSSSSSTSSSSSSSSSTSSSSSSSSSTSSSSSSSTSSSSSSSSSTSSSSSSSSSTSSSGSSSSSTTTSTTTAYTCPEGLVVAVVDFEGLGAGSTPSQLCFTEGLSSSDLRYASNESPFTNLECIAVRATGPNDGPMIFDAACGDGTDSNNCTGGETGLFYPAEGGVLILSADGVSADPDADDEDGDIIFSFNTTSFHDKFSRVFVASVVLLEPSAIDEVFEERLPGDVVVIRTEAAEGGGSGGPVTVAVNSDEVRVLVIKFQDSPAAAVARITLCLEEGTTTTSTSTSSSSSSSSSSSTSSSSSSSSSTSSSSSSSSSTSSSSSSSSSTSSSSSSSSSTSSSSSSSSSTSSSSSSSSSTSSSSSSSSSTSSSSSSSSSTSSSASSTTSTTTSTTVTKSTSTSTTTSTEADDFGFDNRKTDSSSTSTSTSTSTVTTETTTPSCLCEEPDKASWCGPGRYNCHGDRWNQSQCEAAGCCYHEEYSEYLDASVPMCFKPKEWPLCAQVELDHRLECGPENISRDDCEEQGCCWGPNNESAPVCFFGPQYWRPFAPKMCPKQSRVRIEAGYDGIDRKECESRGACWNEDMYFQEEDAPEAQHSCYLPTPRRECRRIEVADRVECKAHERLGRNVTSAQECISCGCCVRREEEAEGPACFEPQDPSDEEEDPDWKDDYEYPGSATGRMITNTPMRVATSYTCPSREVTKTEDLTCDQFQLAKSKIVDQFNSIEEKCAYGKCRRADFAGCILRLAGHDFMDYYDGDVVESPPGGSDGCIDLDDPDNKGLEDCLLDDEPEFPNFSLLKAWKTTGGLTQAPCEFMSFADWIVLAAEVVMELTRPQNGAPLFTNSNGQRIFAFGRETQEECYVSEVNKMPNPEKGCQENDRVFIKNLELTVEETVAIMGVHSLGRCRYENSGFDGGWEASLDTKIFDTTYYKSMITNGWIREQTPPPFSKTQWRRSDGGANTYKKGSGFTGPGYQNLWKEIMLDTDLCLAYSELVTYDDENDVNGDYSSMPLKTREQGKEKCDCAWKSPIFSANLPPHKKKFAVADVVNNSADRMFCGWPLEDVPFNFNEDKRICCAPYNYDEHELALARSMNEIRDCGGNPTTTPGVGGPSEGRSGWSEQSAEAVFEFAQDDAAWVETFTSAWRKATSRGHTSLQELEVREYCQEAIVCGGQYEGDTVGARKYAFLPNSSNSGAVVYEFCVPENLRRVTLSTCARYTNFDTHLYLESAGGELESVEDGCNEGDNPLRSTKSVFRERFPAARCFDVFVSGTEGSEFTNEGRFRLSVNCRFPEED